MDLFRNGEGKRECVREENLSNSHTIIKGPEWFSLKHLKPSWLEMQQVSCSSAGGLVIEGWAAVRRGRDDWWPQGECQSHKSSRAWPTAPINFIYICTLCPPLKFLCLVHLKLWCVWCGSRWGFYLLYPLFTCLSTSSTVKKIQGIYQLCLCNREFY